MTEHIRQNLRPDLRIIADIIPEGSKVLDLGCGSGDLLYVLKHKKNVKPQGVEISQEGIMECISKGIPVFQGNINEGLADFADGSFDYVIVSQTLQVVFNVQMLTREILRVGNKAIVSFPNFGYWQLRFQLLFSGHMPKSKMLPYDWYNTPNIRLMTISDFYQFCRKNNIKIERELFVEPNGQLMSRVYNILPNWLAHLGIFVIGQA